MKAWIIGSLLTAMLSAGGFTLKSPEFSGQMADEQVFNGFGCSGENFSPALSWQNAPKGTRSFALTMYDPDAPTGSGWWHWVMFNIPGNVHALAKNAGDPAKKLAPEGSVQSRTDYGVPGYGGACPPVGHGAHRYVLSVYALDVKKLDLDAGASPALVGFYLNAHTLAKASLVTYYGR